MSNIPEFSVTELTNLTKNLLEDNFDLIKVRGEISGLKNFKGHLYFAIKDENYVLNCVCWASKVPFLNIQPEDGIEILAEGKVSTYAKGSISTYQLQVSQIEIKGEGALLKLFEQRKAKLEKEGLFKSEHKKDIPYLPKSIGVITSPSGAVIMDILDRIKTRFPTPIKIFPVSVQGPKASEEIISALNYFEKNLVDLIIIARGGGGIEDFIPFNDENLIRRVFKCNIPVISAIGHETDFTLLDFVADLRAPTPTAAAEMSVPEKNILIEKIILLTRNLNQSMIFWLKQSQENINSLNSLLNFKNLKRMMNEKNKVMLFLGKNLKYFFESLIKIKFSELNRVNSLLNNLNIDNILKRGFVLLKNNKNELIKSSKNLNKNKNINIYFYDDTVNADINIKK